MTFTSLINAFIKNIKYIGFSFILWFLMAYIFLALMPVKYEAQSIVKLGEFSKDTPIAGAAEAIEYLRSSDTLISVASDNNVSPIKLSKRIRTHPIDNNKEIKIQVHWDSVDDAERLVSALAQRIVNHHQQKVDKSLNEIRNDMLYWEKILEKKDYSSQAIDAISQLKLVVLNIKPTEIVAPVSKSFETVSIDPVIVYFVALFAWAFTSLLIVEYNK